MALPKRIAEFELPAEGPPAPPERAPASEIAAAAAALDRNPLVRALLDATDVSVMVLNRQRQILMGNDELAAELRLDSPRPLLGLRLGEALDCTHAHAAPGGCGTSPECRNCGALVAIVESQSTGKTVERDCLITTHGAAGVAARELRVKASQLTIGGETLTIVGLRDISAEKRRAALERVFLHDVSNTLTPLLAWSQVLARRAEDGGADSARRVHMLARRLQHEIESHRALLHAEAGTLATTRGEVVPEAALDAAAAVLEGDPAARGRRLEIVRRASPAPLRTDEALLVRVLVNMMKNALEASSEGGLVKAWAEPVAGGCELRVWNEGAIDPEVALQVFRRSFSTKAGTGRGLGTFSMKLFGERYLGGEVGFTSSPEDGTTFYIRLPGS